MRRHSLLRRVAIRLVAVTAVTLIATIGLLIWQFEHATGVVVDSTLTDMLEVVTEHVLLDSSGKVVSRLPDDLAAKFHEEYFFTVTDREGQAYFSIPPGRDQAYHPFSPDQTDKPQYFEHRYIESNDTYLGVTQHIVRGGMDFWVQIVEEVPYWQTLAYYSIELFVEGLAVLILLHMVAAAALCYYAVRLTLAPVRRAATEAQRIGPHDTETRIDTSSLPGEVSPLAEAANDALDRLKTALEAQRRFTADAAHEFLTPIAVIRAELESAPTEEWKEGLLQQVDEIADVARQLLELSELDAMSRPPSDPCDLRAIAEEAVAKLARQAMECGIEPRLIAPGHRVVVPGCPKGLRTALSNLLRNAIQHAEGASFVVVRVEPPGRVSVIDDGCGIPPSDREHVFRRFYRSGSGRNSSRGLGLAIVERIVKNHGGEVRVTEGPDGSGAAFVIDLPGQKAADGGR